MTTRRRLRALRHIALPSALATVLATAAFTGGAAATAPAETRSGPAPASRQASAHVTILDERTHTLRAMDGGRTVAVFPVGFGQPRFPTPSGTFHVLGKDASIRMTSCSAGITCDPGNPDYYNLDVHWAVRLTESGVFIHAAPWDKTIGTKDISHGCIHLSTANAKWFYDFSQVGDTVIVQNTGSTSMHPAGP